MKRIFIILLIIIAVLALMVLSFFIFFTGDKERDCATTGDCESDTYNCESNSYNCDDFETQLDAQDVFDFCSPGDIHGLDRDNNGVACEGLG